MLSNLGKLYYARWGVRQSRAAPSGSAPDPPEGHWPGAAKSDGQDHHQPGLLTHTTELYRAGYGFAPPNTRTTSSSKIIAGSNSASGRCSDSSDSRQRP